MNFDVVIFDWDGTLIDSVDHIADSLELAAGDLGYPVREREALRHIVGLGMEEALSQLWPGITREEMTQLREVYARYFFQRDTTPADLFEGVDELLETLHGGPMLAVATGKSRPGLDRALGSSGLGRFFPLTRCANETASKPDPLMLRQIVSETGASVERMVMVGDTIYDMEMASRIGMPAIGVTWGVHSEEQLSAHNPMAIASDISKLRELMASGGTRE
ncbi:HAD-IA family hydrolase [uncultured Halovibrio sp.]|uniref:HAD family hydrolase n=1 Tax=uncultured Halovibrio sp. TaxID=985049 RepID=UPI0025D1300B|nr:HAD-IA family hydrolase [uncultured Halovibrio sp.]